MFTDFNLSKITLRITLILIETHFFDVLLPQNKFLLPKKRQHLITNFVRTNSFEINYIFLPVEINKEMYQVSTSSQPTTMIMTLLLAAR